MGTESCPEPRRQPTSRDLDAVIPIAGFMIIDAGTASSSPFQHTPKIVHHHAGIVFTFIWNPRSRCAGNREHDRPEYADYPQRRPTGWKDGQLRNFLTEGTTRE
jgi:hypothetical protein